MGSSSIHVVIVNWRRPDDTIACVRSVLASDTGDLRIVVVDNGSGNGSVERIADACPEVDLISLPENLGYAGGYNTGIEQALTTNSENVMLLNNDNEVAPSAIQALLEAPWDVRVPKILFARQPGRIWAAGARWRPFPPSVVMRGYRHSDGPTYDQAQPLEYATGCALMVQRQVFESVGAFDPLFESYLEDYDFSYRARAAGFSIGYVPSSRVFHKVAQSLGESSPRRWWYLGRNSVLFYGKEDRFPRPLLWLHLTWYSIRELGSGNRALLTAFWRGVIEGHKLLDQSSSRR